MTCQTNAQTQGLCRNVAFSTATNRIVTSGYSYDAAGNLTQDSTTSPVSTYTWDAEDHLVTITQGGNTYSTTTYNANGQSVESIFPGFNARVESLFDPAGNELGHYNGQGNYWWDRDVWLGGRMVAQLYPGVTYFLHANHLHSDTQVTDQAGTVQTDILYYPFGETWKYVGLVDSHFAGFQQSAGTLYRTPTRQYANALGRWLSPDPAGLKAVRLNDPQTWNAYAYVRNNPTTLTDPTGLCDAPKGLGPGQVGICVASYIKSKWFKLIGRGDDRDTEGNGGTARIETHLIVDPKTGKVTNQGDTVARSGIVEKNFGLKGVGQSKNTQGSLDVQGNAHFQVSQDAHSALSFGGLLLGSIDNHLNLEVTPDQKVGIDPGSTAKDFPSLEVYRYTTDGSSITTTLIVNKQEVGNGDALNQPEQPLPSQAPQ